MTLTSAPTGVVVEGVEAHAGRRVAVVVHRRQVDLAALAAAVVAVVAAVPPDGVRARSAAGFPHARCSRRTIVVRQGTGGRN